MLTGPDVSEHQGNVRWNRVADRHTLAIARISDGDHRDPWYTEERVDAIRRTGMLFAPYYFARVASPQNLERDGEEEAKMAIRFARSRGWRWPGDLPLIYDIETTNAQPLGKVAKHTVQFVRAYKQSQDHYPGIYTMPGFWNQVLPFFSNADLKLLAKCFLYQAEWGVDAPQQLAPWEGAAIWQWTNRGRCPGVTGEVDMNRTLIAEQRILALAKREQRPEPEDGSGGPGPHPSPRSDPPPDQDPEPDRPPGVPQWVPRDHWQHWLKPWTKEASASRRFRELCWDHGFVSPHFEVIEAACHDALNTPVPGSLRTNTQRQGFNLERLRHELGDKALPTLSWFRTPAHNAAVGGASLSRHMQADATDFTTETVNSFGASKFDSACDRIYSNGGFGKYPSGSRHVDSRGSKARW